jgi:acetyl esterase/lipase
LKDIRYYPDSINKSDPYINSQCVLDLYYPSTSKNFATIIWLHAGGLTGGNNDIPDALLNTGNAIVSVEYRLSPNVKSPCYIEDAAAATAWVMNHIKHYGGNEKQIFLVGHSAGAYLGLMITLDKKYLNKYVLNVNGIAGLFSLSGQAITHYTIRAEKGIKETQATIDEMAPLYHVCADAPAIYLFTGDRELELYGRYEENAYLARMLKLVGHNKNSLTELPGFNHGDMPKAAFDFVLIEIKKLTEIKPEDK